MSVFNKIRSWFVVPVVTLASFATAPAQGQLTCSSPADVGLGSTSFATLLSFPAFTVSLQCGGQSEIAHAVFHRFAATQSGWYSAYAIPDQSWVARVAVLDGCGPGAGLSLRDSDWTGVNDAGDACGPWRRVASVSFYLEAGQARVIVTGGASAQDAGHGYLRIERIGDGMFDGAIQLAIGQNPYQVGPLAPTFHYQEPCGPYILNSRRFTFTPQKTGTHRISFCSDGGAHGIAISDDPSFPPGQVSSTYGGCTLGGGGRITLQLQGGVQYYVVAGYSGNYSSCQQLNATVEYIDPCPADLNDDDSVDGKDLAILISGWGTAEADITNDGNTDGVDLGILLASWGACTG